MSELATVRVGDIMGGLVSELATVRVGDIMGGWCLN